MGSRLLEELRRLERLFGVETGLTVRWLPDSGSERHGEVKGGVIYIYDERFEEAVSTLRHEFVDYYVSVMVVEPLIKYINLQKCLIEELIYGRKEIFVMKVLRLLRLSD